jgi:hypothetical protein
MRLEGWTEGREEESRRMGVAAVFDVERLG